MTNFNTTEFLQLLQTRFEKNMHRHTSLNWSQIQSKLEQIPKTLNAIFVMEESGGEPDVMILNGQICFVDFVKESPIGRRSFCYDKQALDSRKEHKPKDNVVGFATKMGVELLTENEYREVQKLEKLDLKTSSWVLTPANIRQVGGAIFCDNRYGTIFTYHNGAESYYAARGFRTKTVL